MELINGFLRALVDSFHPIGEISAFFYSVVVYILVRFGVMECPYFKQLAQTLRSSPGSDDILAQLGEVLDKSPTNEQRTGIELVLRQAFLCSNKDQIMDLIANNLPQDHHHEERLQILLRVPALVTRYPDVQNIIAKHLANTIMETEEMPYLFARSRFGEFLIQIPAMILARERSVAETLKNEDKIEILAYMEEFVKPMFVPADLRLSNSMYSVMAKKAPKEKFEMFFKCVMASDHFSYHNLMAALTHRVKDHNISMDNALDYMTKKKNPRTTNEVFGLVSRQLADKIEYDFVTSVLKNCDREQTDKLMNGIRRRELLGLQLTKKITFELYDKLVEQLPANATLDQIIENMTDRCILTRQAHVAEKRHEVLSATLALDGKYDEMSPKQKRMFYSILATQSFPKASCELEGSDFLFKKLAIRLFEMLPERGTTNADIEINEFSSLLYCMHSLFDYRNRHKRIIRDVEPDWGFKVLYNIDLHIMTSSNLVYKIKNESDEELKLKMIQINHIYVITGKLLLSLFDVFSDGDLLFMPHYWSVTPFFMEFLYTDSFNMDFMANLTSIQLTPGPPVKLLGGDDHERIQRFIDADNYDEDTDEEEEEDDDDEDAGSDAGDNGDNAVENVVNEVENVVNEDNVVAVADDDEYDDDNDDDDDVDDEEDDEGDDDDDEENDEEVEVEVDPDTYDENGVVIGSNQWYRNFYGLPNGITAEFMAPRPGDVPVSQDPTYWEND